MEKVCVFLADGFEEGEALIPVDLLRRAGAEVTTASISTSLCAAPGLLGEWGLLQGRRATCYPSAEEKCAGAVLTRGEVCTDGNLVTGRGLGAAIPFGLALVGHIAGQAESARIQEAIVYMP